VCVRNAYDKCHSGDETFNIAQSFRCAALRVVDLSDDKARLNAGETRMMIAEAQHEIRARYAGGYYGQLVSGIVWLTSAALAVWVGPRPAIVTLFVGGFFIFPLTELLARTVSGAAPVSEANSLQSLGMQVALVLPMSMPLLVPIGQYRLTWSYQR
jgi:hypothetical protein